MTNQTVYDTKNKGKSHGNFTDYCGFIYISLRFFSSYFTEVDFVDLIPLVTLSFFIYFSFILINKDTGVT